MYFHSYFKESQSMIYIYTTLENTLEQYRKWKPSESHVLLFQDSNERTDKKKTLRISKLLKSWRKQSVYALLLETTS